MPAERPRGIAVTDVGYTNTKLVLFDSNVNLVAERKVSSRHIDGPDYKAIDPEPAISFFRSAIPELDAILPVDVVVPCAHGAAMACVAKDGSLALPVMDYLSDPPAGIRAEYLKIAPSFTEAYCTTLPVALTHGLQLYWQQEMWPHAFANIAWLMPWIQYVGFRLCGVPSVEITSMSCQSHLMNVASGSYSSLAKRRGWDRLFPPMRNAWDVIGNLKPEFCGQGLRGRAAVLAGIHDSSANYVRYQSAGLEAFTLLSTGTWSIAFDAATPVSALDEARDTCTNTGIFGQRIATSRFFAGKEYEILTNGADFPPSLEAAATLIKENVFALPSFSDAGGPVPRSGLKGRIEGPAPSSPEGLTSLASLYCALMVSEQLDAVGSRGDIIVDGPFAKNACFLSLLAALRNGQRVLASDMRDGTTAGAACLALLENGKLPRIELKLRPVTPAIIESLSSYAARWRPLAYGSAIANRDGE
jgi:sugar (pentulose or hexulose) kinase